MSAETTNEGCAKIAADKLIEMIASTEPVAEVENDEECYVTPQAEIEIDEDGLCSLCVHQSIPGNPDLGNFRFKVGGVNVSVSRDMDGPGDVYEFEGAEIVCDEDTTMDDVIAAIEEHVEFPDFEDFQSDYNDTDFDIDDVEASVKTDGEIFAEDDEGNIYAFDSEEDIPEEMTAIDTDAAIHRLAEDWDGNVDGLLCESGGPWG